LANAANRIGSLSLLSMPASSISAATAEALSSAPGEPGTVS
jgi:hypothetical protein